MSKTLCIYHGDCFDGFASAWIVRKALGEERVDFYKGVYQQEPPNVRGKDVILVDFSYKRDAMKRMLETAKSVLVIDHHVSALENLRDLSEGLYFMDVEHSGSMLTWKWYFPDKEAPLLIQHVEDRDLWKFKLEGTKEIMASVGSYEMDFEVWDWLMETDLERLRVEGIAICRAQIKWIKDAVLRTQRKMLIGGYEVDVANLPHSMASEGAGLLAAGRIFGACYYDGPEGRVFSLRSDAQGLDVAKVAEQYGGGGHIHAAGFKVSFKDKEDREV